MSLKSWKKEFCPIEVKDLVNEPLDKQFYYTHLKWTGLSKENLNKHDLIKEGVLIGSPYVGDNTFIVRGDSCVFCVKHNNKCFDCPLKYCNIDFRLWLNSGNPKPMIDRIKKAWDKQKSNTNTNKEYL